MEQIYYFNQMQRRNSIDDSLNNEDQSVTNISILSLSKHST